jgi:hypothetical protein
MMYEEAEAFGTSLLDLKDPADAPFLRIDVTGAPVK